jgi:blue copper oxidase
MNKNLLFLLVCGVFLRIEAQVNPLFIPDTLSGNTINLTLKNGTKQFVDGNPTQTMGANGDLLGPTLILRKNNFVQINVKNELGEPSTIHWHGLHVAPENDGGPHIVIQDQETWRPSFTVLDNASTYWYHPHLHHKTNEHVQKGIAGFILVRDNEEEALVLPRTYGIDDIPLVVQTKGFDANNQIIPETALDTFLLVNGTNKAYSKAYPQVMRYRLLNGSSERFYNFGFSNNLTFYQIGSDGGLLNNSVAQTRILLAPGERAEILINLAGKEGETIQLINYGSEIPNAIYGARQPGMGQGQTIPNYSLNPLNGSNTNILEIRIENQQSNIPVLTIPNQLISNTPYNVSDAKATRNISFMSMNMGPTAIQGPFMFNNQMFDMDVVNYSVDFNTVEIWELRNQTPIAHPFHIHHHQFYILDINGVAPPAHLQGRKDVVMVPAGNGVVRFIIKFENFHNDTLPYMYHCHMLTHEDHGMMGQFVIKSPSDEDICDNLISTQPKDQFVLQNQDAYFSTNSLDNNATYAWQSNIGFGFLDLHEAGQYSGTNSKNLKIAGVQSINNNQLFRCIVTGPDCKDTTNIARLSVELVGLNKISKSDFKIYPNPNNGQFRITSSMEKPLGIITLTDVVGKTIATWQTSQAELEINLKDINKGLYYIKVQDNLPKTLLLE